MANASISNNSPRLVQEYQFGECVIHLGRRELRVRQQPRVVTKKVFDVLVYLIANRDRVISRDELLDQNWHGRVVVDNVLARTIMLARNAIDDLDPESPRIRTITRVGYRFVAETTEIDSPAVATGPVSSSQKQASHFQRIAVLPFANDTGDPTLVWIELGLMSLAVRCLGQNKLILPMAVSSVLSTLERGTTKLESEVFSRLRRALAVDLLVTARLTQNNRCFELTYSVISENQQALSGSVAGHELTQLGLELARAIEFRLITKSANQSYLDSVDPFVNECIARGLHASSELHWQAAEKFLGLGHSIEPENLGVKTLYVYALARLGREEAIPLAQELLDTATATRNIGIQMKARYIIALALLFAKSDVSRAIESVDHALAIDHQYVTGEWRVLALSLRTVLALKTKDINKSLELADLGIRESLSSGDKVHFISHLINRGSAQASSDLNAAMSTCLEAAALCRSLGQHQAHSVALGNLFQVQVGLGMHDNARNTLGEYTDCLGRMREPIHRLSTDPIWMVDFLFRLRLFAEARALIQLFRDKLWAKDEPASFAARHWLASYEHRIDRRADAAFTELVTAAKLLEVPNHYPEFCSLLLDSAIQMARLGRWEEAHSTIARLDAYPQFSDDPDVVTPVLYFRALEAAHRGSQTLCVQLLGEAVEASRNSFWCESIRLDQAYCYVLLQMLPEAERLLSAWPEVFAARPEGLFVNGLLLHATGQTEAAKIVHLAFLDKLGKSENAEYLSPASILPKGRRDKNRPVPKGFNLPSTCCS